MVRRFRTRIQHWAFREVARQLPRSPGACAGFIFPNRVVQRVRKELVQPYATGTRPFKGWTVNPRLFKFVFPIKIGPPLNEIGSTPRAISNIFSLWESSFIQIGESCVFCQSRNFVGFPSSFLGITWATALATPRATS